MIGSVVAWDEKFLVISTGEEVYRTEHNPSVDYDNKNGIGLEDSVEFDIANNRAVNLKKIFFAPDMNALRRSINKIEVFNQKDIPDYEQESEGAKIHDDFGDLSAKYTRNPNPLDLVLPIMKELGFNLCYIYDSSKQIATDDDKMVYVYDHSFHVGIVATLTRVKDEDAQTQAFADYEAYKDEMNIRYLKMCSKHAGILRIQNKLYFGNKLSRKYANLKLSPEKHDEARI